MTKTAIDYSIKKSKRAKHVSLKVSSRSGLVITVPERFNVKKIPKLLAQKQEWLEAHRTQLSLYAKRKFEKNKLPEELQFSALEENWTIKRGLSRFKADRLNMCVWLPSELEDEAAQKRLNKWVAEQAKQFLTPLTHQMAEEMEVEINKVTIRNQSSRWGSCARSGEISLNQKLLFVPYEHVEYIIVHELCHVAHPHHGAAFWKEVEGFLPNYKAINTEMRHSAWETYVPLWAG